MKQYSVTGMSCAACSARVEKAVSSVSGVESCNVSLLTNTLSVNGDVDDDEIIKAVTDAGYGAAVKNKYVSADNTDHIADKESHVLLKRFLVSLVFLLVLMYVSMGYGMFGFPIPSVFEKNPVANGMLQMILTATVMIINKKFFISGFRGVVHAAPNMDTLVALGSSASFIRSVYALFMMTKVQIENGVDAAAKLFEGFYFESAAMILVLITVGKFLEAKSKGKTTDALRALIRLKPKTATLIRDGKEITVNAEELKTNDIFFVRPGESIPTDGIVIEGFTSINESALTGESIPVDKNEGDAVSAATVNQSGSIKCKVTRTGDETMLAQIIRSVEDAAATKAPIAKIADKVSGIFVPVVVGISVITFIIWMILGNTFDFALTRAISVLVISCPCALGLATPVAIMVGNGVGAKHGILFKTATSLEETGKIGIVALDKTGTVTKGKTEVVEVIPARGINEESLLTYAYSLESGSEHPLAKAVVGYAEERDIKRINVSDFTALPGNGLRAKIGNENVFGGSVGYISSVCGINDDILAITDDIAEKGFTPLLFAKEKEFLGIISVADTLKEDTVTAVAELRKMGISVVMLSGDNIKTAKAIGEKAGIKNVIAGVLPDEKAAVVRRLSELGKIAMVGDGINDAPALTSADIGIAIGAGTDVAIDAADVVLINSHPRDVPSAIRLSAATLRNIRENLFWAFIYNIVCIPLAAGCYYYLFGWALNPMIGAAAMSLSSFCVVMNSLRLNLFKIDSDVHFRKKNNTVSEEEITKLTEKINSEKEKRKMTKTIIIEGMMCPHCEAHTKKALEQIPGVEKAEASHTEKKATVTFSGNVSDDSLKKAVEDAGYTVLGIE